MQIDYESAQLSAMHLTSHAV